MPYRTGRVVKAATPESIIRVRQGLESTICGRRSSFSIESDPNGTNLSRSSAVSTPVRCLSHNR
ncbi:MAG: hypothetical protein V7629_17200, partial [Motiliproteus sp.]